MVDRPISALQYDILDTCVVEEPFSIVIVSSLMSINGMIPVGDYVASAESFSNKKSSSRVVSSALATS